MAKRSSKSRNISVYSNLTHKRKSLKDAAARKKAEYLASLPKNPITRFFYRIHPRQVARYWFSRRGLFMALKIAGVAALVLVLFIGALFAYFRKDLESINPDQLSKRVQTTVTTYEDRNGNVLWQDTGGNEYKLVIKSNEIPTVMKQATVAIEDKNFYKEGPISVTGTIRAALNNVSGGATQGGSTITEQLVKQVFFSSQESNRGISGIPRIIKEMILSVEVGRVYSKDQILTLYLNESPYGGQRNGVESASETYFGIHASQLDLAQAALLAAIPNEPGVYNPYNTAGNQALIQRQHLVLKDMVQQGYITQAQATTAQNEPIIDTIKPEGNQFNSTIAPWFIESVRQELNQKLGTGTVGQGGLIVKTTLDSRIQTKLNQLWQADVFDYHLPGYGGETLTQYGGFSDGATQIEDTKTSQILAMEGSSGWQTPGFGETDATNSFIQPGSTIKPEVYAQLFSNQGAGKKNYGSGSVLPDDNSDNIVGIYGAPLSDDDNKYEGNISIRLALARSRNLPAVEAMYVADQNNPGSVLKMIHSLGDTPYCTNGVDKEAGLSAAIGGCGTTLRDHVNAYTSLARLGTYKPITDILSVTNSQGKTLLQYKDSNGTQVLDPQAAYILADILSDDNARKELYGTHYYGLYIPGVKTAAKTGTSNAVINGKAVPKDVWTMSYSPAITMGVWLGNPDTTPLTNGNSAMPGKVIGDMMTYIHEDVYQPAGEWHPGEWYTPPAGIQTINGEVYPSYYNSKTTSNTTTQMTFDSVSKRLATNCTPDAAKVQETVTVTTDPISGKKIYTASDGYDANDNDNVHDCSDTQPSIGNISASMTGGANGNGIINVSVNQGTHPLQSLQISVNGTVVGNLSVTSTGTYSVDYGFSKNTSYSISATVTDNALYSGNSSITYNSSGGGGGGH